MGAANTPGQTANSSADCALDHELKSADIARRLAPVLGGPAHLHERGNQNRNIHHREIAAQQHGNLKRNRAEDTNAAIAEIVNAAVEFLGQGSGGLTRQHASRMHFEHLRKPCVLTPLLIRSLLHSKA